MSGIGVGSAPFPRSGRSSRAVRVWHLLPLWTRREVRVQYRQSALDLGWSLLTPVITLAGYGIVLTRAFGVSGDGVPYLSFAWTGVVVWTFVANGLIRGALSLVAAAELVRKVSFPREVVPIATVLASGLDLLVGMAALGVLMAIQGVQVSVKIVAVVPVVLVLLLWTCACAVIFATITAFVRDVAHGLNVFLRIGIFVTPVMYPASRVPHRYHWALSANPISVFIEGVRDTVLRRSWPQWSLLGIHTAVALTLLIVAAWYVRRVEGRMADVI